MQKSKYEKAAWPYVAHVSKDETSLIYELINLLEKKLRLRVSSSNQKPIGLATGRTMQPIYKQLVSRLSSWKQSDLEALRSGWCSFNLDEYVGLEKSHPNSFSSFMRRNLAEPLGFDQSKVHLPNGMSKDLILEANNYSRLLKSSGGIGLQLLGLGVNGHIGFNEPPCDIASGCHLVTLSASTRQQNVKDFSGGITSVPLKAITLGISDILSSQEIHLVVTGEHKAEILRTLLHSEPIGEIPASWLKVHNNVHLWADKSAMDYP
ncbi:glucosamine-6-phosphate deaminase [Prochlorococcus sp. MIT 1341]|uniref:glucosamine-6-phosphate deaminase n=1 Tax=Prochlorococcus sp. MIT 1341 TaxID=3096221 RepID=UPI002A748EA0|nr:glucosamine-6-phosphate deaminase [Prochlorococcus sp. MIT 1341]